MANTTQLTTADEWREFHPVVADFWPVETVDEYLETLEEMTAHGYRTFGLYAGDPVSFAGVFTSYCSWYGSFVWLLDLVTHPDRRGEGHGSDLYTAVEEWARENGYETVVLASGKSRDRTHRFYERHGFEMTEYWFEKSIAPSE